MRKTRRETDKNTSYTPSPAKVSATINQLLEWEWLERRDSIDIDNEGNKKGLKGLSKVFYSLSQEATFAFEIGLNPDEDFKLEDAFHLVLSSAAIGWDYIVWDEDLEKVKVVNIEGTFAPDIIFRQDHHNTTISKYKRFTKLEIQRAIEIVLEKKMIQKKIIDNVIKYIVVENLRDFISFCWKTLFWHTWVLVQNVIVLKRILKRSEEYQIFFSWFSKFHDSKRANDILVRCSQRRTTQTKEGRLYLLKIVKEQLEKVSLLKKEAYDIYEKNVDSEDIKNFAYLKEAVIRYTCPENVMAAVNSIITSQQK